MTKVRFEERRGLAVADLEKWEAANAPYILPDDYSAAADLRRHVAAMESEALLKVFQLGCLRLND